MEIIGILLFIIFLDFLSFMNREKEEERIYQRTVNDVNFNRHKKCNCK